MFLLVITLFISPLAKLTLRLFGNDSVHASARSMRRSFGLATTSVALMHTYFVYQSGFVTQAIAILTEPQWRNGVTALLVLCLLAMTSFPPITRLLRIRQWKTLHRLAYVAMVFAVLHVLVSPSLRRTDLMLLGGLVIGLLIARVFAAVSPQRMTPKPKR
jgi:DMSO/TMAO reductase YedYZ heme-binding membrane subunit